MTAHLDPLAAKLRSVEAGVETLAQMKNGAKID
jgi:hypothetical protein